MIPGEKIEVGELTNLVERHMAFLIRTVSNFTGRYVSAENDEEFSIALSAFAEAVEKYDKEKGNFLGFAKLVIESRLKNHIAGKKKKLQTVSLEELYEAGRDFSDEVSSEATQSETLHEEIVRYREELLIFGLTLEALADEAPKHKDTRKTAVEVAEKVSQDEPTVKMTYKKKKLPIRRTADIGKVSEKVVKRSKCFILATMLIFVKRLPELTYWIKGTRCTHVS